MVYQAARSDVCDAAHTSLPLKLLNYGLVLCIEQIRIDGLGSPSPVGGYFLWIEMPAWCRSDHPELSPEQLLTIAREPPYAVIFTLGKACRATNARVTVRPREHIRMCFAKYVPPPCCVI